MTDERPPINETEAARVAAAAPGLLKAPKELMEQIASLEDVKFAMREAFDIAAAYYKGLPPAEGLRHIGDIIPTVLADIAANSPGMTAREIDRRVTHAVREAVGASGGQPQPSFDPGCVS